MVLRFIYFFACSGNKNTAGYIIAWNTVDQGHNVNTKLKYYWWMYLHIVVLWLHFMGLLV